jgi:two-component system, chemotaxis family, chemotaxis protein CheY
MMAADAGCAKILVVDDSAMIRRRVSNTLAAAGYGVVEAVDGVDAWQKLAASPDVQLVVCDVIMPRMSGLELLENLQLSGGPRRTLPVVMITNEAQPDLIHRANALGAKGWLVKPFTAEVLIDAVRKLIG